MAKIAWMVTYLAVWVGLCQMAVGMRLQDGRYEDVVLAVDPSMGTHVITINELKTKVKILLEATSNSLHAATDGKFSLGSVKVVIPQTWDVPEDLLGEPAEDVSWSSADIRLEEPQRDYRGNYMLHTPNTLQPGQCGVPGRHITIHTTFLDAQYAEENYGSQGGVMVHEWAHYRWGVMEEHGFPGDTIFPVHYSRGEQIDLPTSCYDGELDGNYQTEEGVACNPSAPSPTCYFVPNASASPTKGSLMYLTHLSDGHFCNRSSHNPWAPTPQNIHCGRRSVWEIIESHDDFLKTGEPHEKPAEVAVTYHKSQTPRVFILFDPPTLEASESAIKDMVKMTIQDLSRKFGSVEIGMATFRLQGENVNIIKKRDFGPVTNLASLDQFMPTVSDRLSENTVPLGRAVAQLVPSWTEYTPGTLLVALVYNHVTSDEAAAVESETLLKKKVKMLLLDGLAELGHLSSMAPVLQEAGGRIYGSSNMTVNEMNLQNDIEKYLKNHHFNDHIVYGVSTTEIKTGENVVGNIQLDTRGLSFLNLVMKIDSFDPAKFSLILKHPLTASNVACGTTAAQKINFICENFDGGIYATLGITGAVGSDTIYQYKLTSTSQEDHSATMTWSTVETDVNNTLIYVDLWSSEDRGIKANISESAALMLFCEVAHPQGYLEELTITAEVRIDDSPPFFVNFVDDRVGEIDTRKNDSVWTAIIPGKYSAGSELTVTKLAINHNPDIYSPINTGNNVRSKREVVASSGGSAAPSGSSALPKNPWDGSCCGSFHDGKPFKDLPINRFFRFPYKTNLTRDIEDTPPKVVGLEPDENSEQQVEGDVVKVTFKWGSRTETRTARSNPDSFIIRYSTDLYELIDDFQNAKEPLEGTGTAPGTASETVVSLPYDELVNKEVYLSIASNKNGVVGPPATATAVTINEKTTTTTVTTTTVTTTTTTTTTVATTPDATTAQPTTPSDVVTNEVTTTPLTTTTDSASSGALCPLLFAAVMALCLTLR